MCQIIFLYFIIQKLKFCKIEKEDTLIKIQLEIDHVTQQPKETCQRTCRGPKLRIETSSLREKVGLS